MVRLPLPALVALTASMLLFAPTTAAAQSSIEDDFPIPNGHFFTQAAPGQHGAGYRVANEASIFFWDEYLRHGGAQKLGYPVSRRFIWKDRVAQRFQFGALVWRSGDKGAELRNVNDVGEPPEPARLAEPPPRQSGDAEKYPWSGWWWPANHQVGGPRLFDSSGPLAKYDRYVESLGKEDPQTLEWEQAELIFVSLQWAGHCNGWASAALLEPEPTEPRVINDLTFSVGDQKGLLSSWHFADSALWAVGGGDRNVSPPEFHKQVLSWLGAQRKGMILTFRLEGEEVWSYPAYKFESSTGPDALKPDLWHVKTTVWLMDNEVPPNFVGARAWPGPAGKEFEYTLVGDPENPTGGEWSSKNVGRFGHPYMMWYPDQKNRNVDRQLASPALEYPVIQEILGRPIPVAEPATTPSPPAARPATADEQSRRR